MLPEDKTEVFVTRVYKHIVENSLIQPGCRCLVAYSGGVDSAVLLYILLALNKVGNYSVFVAHYNHKLRGRASDEDALFVKSYCDEHNIPCYLGEGDVGARAQEARRSTEDMAREMRYDFLYRTAENIGASVVATGHHADDQAETFMLQLLRGAGSSGLLSMRAKNNKIVRPLLCLQRGEIELLAKQKALPIREDITNSHNDYLRNRVRNELLPHLRKEYNSNITEVLNHTAVILREEHDFLYSVVAVEYEHCTSVDKLNGIIKLDVPKMMELSLAVKRGILRKLYENVTGNLKDISFRHVEILLDALKKKSINALWELPQGVNACWQDETWHCMLFAKKETMETYRQKRREENNIGCFEYALKIQGITRCDKLNIMVTAKIVENNVSGYNDDCRNIYFDADMILHDCNRLVLRNRKSKDVFSPLGMSGSKKLKNFYIDEKVPQEKRDRILLLAYENEILLIYGYRRSKKYILTEKTKRVLHLHFSAI